jgi:hypothetical protein
MDLRARERGLLDGFLGANGSHPRCLAAGLKQNFEPECTAAV